MHAKHHGNSLDQPLTGESEPARCEPSFSVTLVEGVPFQFSSLVVVVLDVPRRCCRRGRRLA
jgi:hypothetical protein